MRRAAHQLLDEPCVFEDPLALRILGPAGAETLRSRVAELEPPATTRLRAFIAARSRYAEDELALAVGRGVHQYVVLGAGLDTFAYRNPHAGTALRVFEVDHPATQAWKRARLGEADIPVPDSLTFAPVDFERQTLADGLRTAGLDTREPAFFSWLGVTAYLSRDTITATLGCIASMPHPGGVVFDFALTPSLMTPPERAVHETLSRRVAAAGEPFQTGFEPVALVRELEGMGFRHVQHVTSDAINARYFAGRRDGLRVSELTHLMSARL